MLNSRRSSKCFAISASVLAIALSAPAIGQDQDAPPPLPPGGRGRGFPQGGPGGPGGRFGGMMPFAMGTITGGDLSAGLIVIQSQFGGNEQTIRVTANTRAVTQAAITVADLKVGDQVQVQGVPTAITAQSITAGQMPEFLPGGGGRGFGPGGAGAGMQAMANATGRVTSTSPLTISLGNDVSVVLKLALDARITKISPIALTKLKVGDRVSAGGQAGQDGTFNATSLAVNIQMGFGMGPGGFGVPGGFGGRGARRSAGGGQPGGPPPPGGDAPPPPPF